MEGGSTLILPFLYIERMILFHNGTYNSYALVQASGSLTIEAVLPLLSSGQSHPATIVLTHPLNYTRRVQRPALAPNTPVITNITIGELQI